jgi:signal transduction histidine kinase
MPVVERRLWTGLGIVSVVMIMFAGWAFMLRRSRTVVREINASLEARVAERTAELAAAKDELDRALVQERELGELKTRFVSMVSHEFRTPLGVTMSAVELLRHFGDRITPEKRIELHEDIHSSTLQMSGLMEQVLLLGRAEAGKLAWQPATLDLPELCQKLSDEMRSSTSQRCPLNFTSEGEFDGAIMDPMMLRHILSNLLSNAVKYSPEGSTVDFRLRREGNDAVFIVADHGIGIPKADQERLFQVFHRASNVGDIQGTGLGLLLAKRCVDLHRGSIALQSKEGAGTTFTVRLPLSQA